MVENLALHLKMVTPRSSISNGIISRISPSHVSTSSPMQCALPSTRQWRMGRSPIPLRMSSVAADTNGIWGPSYKSTRVGCSQNSNSELSNSRAVPGSSNSEDGCAQAGDQIRDRKREKLVYESELAEIELARLGSIFFIASAVLTLTGILTTIWGGTKAYGLWMTFCTNKIGKSAGNNLFKSLLSESFLGKFSSALTFIHDIVLVGYVAGLIKQINSSYELKKAEKNLEFKKSELTYYDEENLKLKKPGLTHYDEKEVIKKSELMHYGEEEAEEAMKKL